MSNLVFSNYFKTNFLIGIYQNFLVFLIHSKTLYDLTVRNKQTYFKSSAQNICKNPGHADICERVRGINTEVTKEAFIHVLFTATRETHCSQQRNILKVYLGCIFQVIPKGNTLLFAVNHLRYESRSISKVH